jgi:hypothetical protein
VQPQHLDAAAELRKFFGARVVNAGAAPPKRAVSASARVVLARPKPEWWPARARGPEEVAALVQRRGWARAEDGDRWWTVEYSRKYKAVTRAFMQTVASGGPCARAPPAARVC